MSKIVLKKLNIYQKTLFRKIAEDLKIVISHVLIFILWNNEK